MIILALECAGGGCGVCVWRDGHALVDVQETMERGQDARLVPMVQDAMATAGLSYAQLDRIAVTTGPGSFTGLRIGLATARGLGFAASKPVLGIDRFALFRAQQDGHRESLLVVLESRRQELYACFYPAYAPPEPPRLMTTTEIAALCDSHRDMRIVGDAAATLQGTVDHQRLEGKTASEALTCAVLASQADPLDPAFVARPLYLRPPDVTVKTDAFLC